MQDEKDRKEAAAVARANDSLLQALAGGDFDALRQALEQHCDCASAEVLADARRERDRLKKLAKKQQQQRRKREVRALFPLLPP